MCLLIWPRDVDEETNIAVQLFKDRSSICLQLDLLLLSFSLDETLEALKSFLEEVRVIGRRLCRTPDPTAKGIALIVPGSFALLSALLSGICVLNPGSNCV